LIGITAILQLQLFHNYSSLKIIKKPTLLELSAQTVGNTGHTPCG
jgi:hypothetical protein